MSRASLVLLLVIATEVLVGGFLLVRRPPRPAPPEADWSLLDPVTARQIHAAVAGCETADNWRDLAELYMAAGCFAESEACHRTACELAPDNALFAREWGFALERLALLDEANAQYRRAIDRGIQDPDACRYFIARNHLRAENSAEARSVFAEGRSLPANRYELARLHLRAGETAEAADLLRTVADVRPNALQVHLLRYRLTLERGARQAAADGDRVRYATEKLPSPFDEEAARIVRATQFLGPNRHWKEGRALINAGELDEAERVLEEAGETYRGAAVVELLAEVAARRGEFDRALRLFGEFQEQNGPAARISARMGDVWDAAGQPEKARANWLHAIELAAGLDLRATHHKLAESFARSGDQPAADRHLAREQYFVGRDLLQLGQADRAVGSFAAAVKHDPALAQAWFYLGESRWLSGQKGEAAEAYATCLRLVPDHGRALAGLASLGTGKER